MQLPPIQRFAWSLLAAPARPSVPADALDAEVERLAGSILAKSAVAIRIGKGMYYKQLEMGLTEAYDYAGEVMACNMMSEDAGEGIDAFMQKRKPDYKGC